MHESGQFAIGRPGRLTNPNWRDPAALMALPTAAFLVGRLYKEESGSRRGPALDARFRPWWASTPGDKREVSRIFDRVKPEAFGSLTGRKVRAESAVDQEKVYSRLLFYVLDLRARRGPNAEHHFRLRLARRLIA